MAAPTFVITDEGLYIASQASPTGPWINVTEFRVGSGFGYEPTPQDTGLNGNTLFSGAPAYFEAVESANAINIVCELPPDAGPWEFGEVSLHLADGTMFAKAVFPKPQMKFSSLTVGANTVYRFNAYIRLKQSVAVFNITVGTDFRPGIWYVDEWAEVFNPALAAPALQGVDMLIVREDYQGRASSLIRSGPDSWTMASNYFHLAYANSTGASATYVDIPVGAFASPGDTLLGRPTHTFVVGFADATFRAVESIQMIGGNYRFNFTVPKDSSPVTDTPVNVYRIEAQAPLADKWTKARTITLQGDVQGSVSIDGSGDVVMSTTLTGQAIVGRNATFTGSGAFSFTVPENVYTIYFTGTAAGGGGGGAGGGRPVAYTQPGGSNAPIAAGGGGGGGGGSGQTAQKIPIAVTPGQVISGYVGNGGGLGLGGNTEERGQDGNPGENTTFGPITLLGGAIGHAGDGNRIDQTQTGAGGAGGSEGGQFGDDGWFGGKGGNGGSNSFGSSGGGARATTGVVPSTGRGIDGGAATGYGAGGGGGGSVYNSSDGRADGGNGGRGANGYAQIDW